MFISKKEKAQLIDAIVRSAQKIVELEEKLEKIEKKLPEYEDAVAKGVDDVWNKAVQSIIDFNPFKGAEDGDG